MKVKKLDQDKIKAIDDNAKTDPRREKANAMYQKGVELRKAKLAIAALQEEVNEEKKALLAVPAKAIQEVLTDEVKEAIALFYLANGDVESKSFSLQRAKNAIRCPNFGTPKRIFAQVSIKTWSEPA